jgi:enoyl-CoA hydratase/carnithine racemase
MTDPILYETLPSGVARIVLNRADTRNAQDTAFLYALNDAFDRAAQDDAVKVIVLSANGPHFSSGHDLREVDGHGNMRKHETVGTWSGFGKPGAEAQYAREQEIYVGFCVVPRAELEAFGLAMAERIAQKPLFALKLTKQAVNAAQDAQGRVSAMQTSFALHHLAHAHNMLAHGKLVDPTGLMPAIKKHQKAAE